MPSSESPSDRELAWFAEEALASGDETRVHDALRTIAYYLDRRPVRIANPRSAARARASYRLTHWGDGGKERGTIESRCANPGDGHFTKLGDLLSVVYVATKAGDPPRSEYEHEFSRPLPELVYSGGGLVIAGGRYRVTWRGIEG